MKTAVEMARVRGFQTPFMVGGAVVTEGFAEAIGAHYSSDGVTAVRLAERLIAARSCQRVDREG
jgi:5-methyltetrahydrofolate--homocysteine methyltransferase